MMKRRIYNIMIMCYVLGAVLLFGACSDNLDIQKVYPFSVETMPVPKGLIKGETAEIRCELKREGRFEDARYTIRYFQTDGKGIFKMDETIFLPNDRYPLSKEVFRLYYTSESTDQSAIDVYVEDDAGQVVRLTFSFANENAEE